jgi:hypothetical protein
MIEYAKQILNRVQGVRIPLSAYVISIAVAGGGLGLYFFPKKEVPPAISKSETSSATLQRPVSLLSSQVAFFPAGKSELDIATLLRPNGAVFTITRNKASGTKEIGSVTVNCQWDSRTVEVHFKKGANREICSATSNEGEFWRTYAASSTEQLCDHHFRSLPSPRDVQNDLCLGDKVNFANADRFIREHFARVANLHY